MLKLIDLRTLITGLLDRNQYGFNPYSIPVLIVGTLVLAVGIFILKQRWKSLINFSLFIFCLSIFFWLSGFFVFYSLKDSLLAVNLYRYYIFLGVSFIASSIYFFSVVWVDLWQKQKGFVYFGLISSFVFYVLGCTTTHVAKSVEPHFWGYYPKYGVIGLVFFLFFLVYFVAAFFNFGYRLIKPIPRIPRSQMKVVFIAFAISFTGSVDYITKFFPMSAYPFGFIPVGIWTMIISFAIVKYRMLDIHTVIHKTLLWMTTTIAFVAPMFFLAFWLHGWMRSLPKGLFMLVVFLLLALFVPYIRIIQPIIDQWFERRRWNLNVVFQEFTNELTKLKTLEELSRHILQTIRRTIYPEDANLLLWDEEKNECLVFTGDGKALSVDCAVSRQFFNFLGSYNRLVFSDYVHADPRLEEIKDEAVQYFESSNAKVCVPIVLEGNLIGAINLSQKANLKDYSQNEVRFLSELRGSAAIAISNSLRLIAMQASLRKWNEELDKQVKERTKQLEDAQSQLIQAEKLATIGTLAGGVAHEINNPLAAILTNAQMLLADNMSLEAKESLELIEEAAERCRVIVQKLMKYSRKSPGEDIRDGINLSDVVETTLSLLKYQLEQENVEVEMDLKIKSNIQANANELSQVFTNLIVNARDAVVSKSNGRKIVIQGEENDSKVVVHVEDNGSGIPPEVIPKIFDPFFTTKDVGKGTGLGLSIVHGIIQKHGGKIEVKSKVGTGTRISLIFPKGHR